MNSDEFAKLDVEEFGSIEDLSPERQIVATLLRYGCKLVFWAGDSKFPIGHEWPAKAAAGFWNLTNYHEGYQVGILTGTEFEGQYLHDIDIDWAPGAAIALAFLPKTGFTFGRLSKPISHCFYVTSEGFPRIERKDPTDDTFLIELRGTTESGGLGWQTMAPPSIWSMDGKREPLAFRGELGRPIFIDPQLFLRLFNLASVGMLLARHMGSHGFNHDVRLAWAGFLLREGVTEDELILMGEQLLAHCNNRDTNDVRQVIKTTTTNLKDNTKKVKGGPALAELLGTHGKLIIATIRKWLGNESDFIRDKNGVIVPDNQDNIRRAIEILGVTLSFNDFADRMQIQTEPDSPSVVMKDSMTDDLWLRIDAELHFKPTDKYFEKVINRLARERTYHPVRDYLNSLKWDGASRIDTWLVVYGGAVDPTPQSDADDSRTYLQAVSSIVLIAAVRRVFHPGSKYDEMLVIESIVQGTNKSSAIQMLCPDDMWFSDDIPLNVGAKILIERTLGKWIIEASDLAGKRKSEIEQLKAFLSRQKDGSRMSYGRKSEERPRHFILIGTTNLEQYLNDPTGARRFWPVKVTRFDLERLKRDRDQLWAEAVVREAQGESIRLPESLWPAAAKEQEQRQEIDPWEFALYEAVNQIAPDSDGKRRVTTDSLFIAVGQVDVSRRDRLTASRISQCMQRLGFSRTKVYDPTQKGSVPGYIENRQSALAEENDPWSED